MKALFFFFLLTYSFDACFVYGVFFVSTLFLSSVHLMERRRRSFLFVVCCPIIFFRRARPGQRVHIVLETFEWTPPLLFENEQERRQAPHQSPSSLHVVDDENSWCSFLIHRRDLCRRPPFILDSAFDHVLCEKNKVCNIITLSFFIRRTKERSKNGTVQEKTLRTEAQCNLKRTITQILLNATASGRGFLFFFGGELGCSTARYVSFSLIDSGG